MNHLKEFPKDKVFENWDLSKPLPLPKFKIKCPVCGSEKIKIGNWLFHKKDMTINTPTPFRCDVHFKCTNCSFILNFGLVIPKYYFDAWEHSKRYIDWRTGKDILNNKIKQSQMNLTEIINQGIKKKGGKHE